MNHMEGMEHVGIPKQEQEADRLLDKQCAAPEEWIRRQEIKEAILETAEASEARRLKGSNEVVYIKFKDGGEGVFKPEEGEDPDFRDMVPVHEFYKRERASFIVDKFLGLELIPTTVIREIGGRVGSVQEFVPSAKSGLEMNDSEREALAAEFYKLGVLDFIIWNADRGRYNYLATGDKVHAIDNSLSFKKNIMTVPESKFLTNRKAPDELVQHLDAFSSWDEGHVLLKKELLELISEEEADACINRIGFISRTLRIHGELDEKTLNAILDNELYNPQ